MTAKQWAAALIVVSGLSGMATAQAGWWSGGERDWKQQLRGDGKELYDAITRVHPGIYDERNPEFVSRMDAALAVLNQRSDSATDFWSYYWAMSEFVASFNDGHLSYSYDDKLPAIKQRFWPGFLTAERLGKQVVLSRADDATLPATGDVLVSCDGTDAATLLNDRVGRFYGRWSLQSQRFRQSYRLFLKTSNPYISDLKSCVFEGSGGQKTVTLNWREISEADAQQRVQALTSPYRGQFEYAYSGNMLRIALRDFDPTPGKETAKTIDQYVEKLAADQARLQTTDAIVLDLRGNGGGSSHYSRLLARAIWGEQAVAYQPSKKAYVEWRPSEEKIKIMDKYMMFAGLMGYDKETVTYWKAVLQGLKDARAQGLKLWREPAVLRGEDGAPSSYVAPAPYKGKVYVLTDQTCASACLDAVDLWKALGGIQVGRETSGDTVYMDISEISMSSYPAKAYLPTKVYRDRPRGNNEPHTPSKVFEGDISDTAAVMAWIRGL